MAQQVQQKPTTAFALSLVGSIFMLISAIVELVLTSLFFRRTIFTIRRFGYMPMIGYTYMLRLSPIFLVASIVGLIISIVALYLSIRLNKLMDINAIHDTGVILLIFSIIGFFTANGFLIGSILLLVGSILTLTWKP